jgi:DNA gyrase subunit A
MSDEQSTKKIGEKRPVTIENELKSSYLDYAMSVIIGRALPDVRDGLKPVHRRILYGMKEGGHTASKGYKKSARIVGDVMGKYHPHGDVAIYDTIVRMAQDFSMRYTLIDGQGNFGSVDGDAPAAMRYTEIRLTRLAEAVLSDDIDKDTVDWAPNYDGSFSEPSVLPSRVPNLLVNGSSGIAVGMATNIPPHNLGEVVDACIALARRPDISFNELFEILPGPDFPTAGFIHGRAGIVEAYRSGRGLVQMRARAVINEEDPEREKGGTIIVTELPYQVNKANLVKQIAALVNAKRLEGISDLRDESDREGFRIVIELKRDAIPEVVLNNLYKLTKMQTTFGIILLAVINNRPKVFTLRQMIQHFIDHRKEVVVRRTLFELEQAKQRAHVLEGLVIALDNLDRVIKLIRESPDPPTARDQLMSELGLSQVQAQAILEMRLQKLTGLERDKIVEEYREILELIKHLEEVLANESMVLDIVIEELQEIRDRFADERRTEIIADTSEISIEDLIAEEEMVITVSRGGYIKRTSLSTYRAQRRGGRGRRGMTTKQEDMVAQLFVASTHDTVLFFTSAGRVFARKVHELPEVSPTSAGRALVNLLQVETGETVETLLAVTDFAEHERDYYLVFATRFGKIKRTALSEYANIRSTGLRAVAIGEGDELLSVHLTNDSTHIFMGTHDGMGIRFPENDVRPMGRVSAGVRGIRLRDGDWVEEVATIDPKDAGDILVVTDLGYGKRTPVSDFRLQGRSGYGMTLVRLTDKNGSVVGIRHVHDDDQVLLVSEKGMLIRMSVEEISQIGRVTQGVRLFRLDDDDRVVAVAKLVEKDDAEENSENGDNGDGENGDTGGNDGAGPSNDTEK